MSPGIFYAFAHDSAGTETVERPRRSIFLPHRDRMKAVLPWRLAVAMTAALWGAGHTMAQDIASQTAALAPKGALRAAINLGNPVLADRDAKGEPTGITIDIARELARRIDRPLHIVTYDGAGKVFEGADKDEWDVAFLAVDPLRAAQIAFTSPYIIIEGAYLVPQASPIRAIDDVDREGTRISVGKGSAYDLYLTRTIKQAALVRAPTSAAAMEAFVTERLDVAAGVRQPLAAFAARHPGTRMIPGRFMVIEQAMGVPHAHAAAAPVLRAFVEDLKTSGFVAAAIARHNQPDALVAPAAPETTCARPA
jgi:polar amino acid transport system substrate-binding protein